METSAGPGLSAPYDSITTAGTQALAAWLATPPTTIDLYLEPLLRVHLARFGTREDLLLAVDATRAAADDILATADAVATEFGGRVVRVVRGTGNVMGVAPSGRSG